MHQPPHDFPGAFDLSGPIVGSLLEPDFYKFTMGQLIWRKYREQMSPPGNGGGQ